MHSENPVNKKTNTRLFVCVSMKMTHTVFIRPAANAMISDCGSLPKQFVTSVNQKFCSFSICSSSKSSVNYFLHWGATTKRYASASSFLIKHRLELRTRLEVPVTKAPFSPAVRQYLRRLLREYKSAGKRYSSSTPSTGTTTAQEINVQLPTNEQLRIVSFRAAIPMVGFGIMDNFVMITAGEAIDSTFGVAFGLSTMAAAGFGQCVSDVVGVTSGGIVDAAVSKLNLKHHGLTPAQLNLRKTRFAATFGACAGVLFGCLVGMSVLFFMDTDKADREKRSKELKSIFESIVKDGHGLVKAERATLFMVDEEKKEVWSQVAATTMVGDDDEDDIHGSYLLKRFTTEPALRKHQTKEGDDMKDMDDEIDDDDYWDRNTDDDPEVKDEQEKKDHVSLLKRSTMKVQKVITDNLPLRKSSTQIQDIIIKCSLNEGFVGHAVTTGKTVNIPNAYSDPRFYCVVDETTGFKTKSVVVVPIFESYDTPDDFSTESTSDNKDVNGKQNEEGITITKKRKVIGAIQMINKRNNQNKIISFDENDEKIITVLASHVASFIRIVDS